MNVEAPVLPCRGCGAPLAINPSIAEASCPRCKTVTAVPGELRQRARVYESSLGAERRKVEFARDFGKSSFDKMGKYFGPPFAILIGGFVVAMMVLDKDDQQTALFAFMGGMAVIGVAFFVWLKIATKREIEGATKPAPVVAEIFEGSVTGTCSTCGGRVPFAVEQHSAKCPYCGATVFPTASDQSALLAIAGERADLESARATRSITRELAKTFEGGALTSAFAWVRWLPLIMVPGMALFAGWMLAFSNGMPDLTTLGSADTTTIIGVALVAGGVLFGVIAVGVVLLLRRLRRGRGDAFGRLAQAFGGKVEDGVRPLLDWLDANWAAAVPGEALNIGASDQGVRIARRSVAFQFMGRPAMVVIADAPHVRRTDLFFSAYRRRAPDHGARTPSAQEVQGAGFSPLVSAAGVHLAKPGSDPGAIAPERVQWLLERAGKIALG